MHVMVTALECILLLKAYNDACFMYFSFQHCRHPPKKNLFIPLQKVTGTNENHV